MLRALIAPKSQSKTTAPPPGDGCVNCDLGCSLMQYHSLFLTPLPGAELLNNRTQKKCPSNQLLTFSNTKIVPKDYFLRCMINKKNSASDVVIVCVQHNQLIGTIQHVSSSPLSNHSWGVNTMSIWITSGGEVGYFMLFKGSVSWEYVDPVFYIKLAKTVLHVWFPFVMIFELD